MSDFRPLMTVVDVATALSVTVEEAELHVMPHLPVLRVGRMQVRVRREDLERWIERETTGFFEELLPRRATSGIYFVLSTASSWEMAMKIGWSSDILERVDGLRTAHPWPLRVVAFIRRAALADERILHARFAHLRIQDAPGREWFRYRGELRDYVTKVREEALFVTCDEQ